MEATITTEPPLEKEENYPLPVEPPALSPCGAPNPGPTALSVPSFLHLWYHCLCHQGGGLHINAENLKSQEEGEEHEGVDGEGGAEETLWHSCLLGLVEVLEVIYPHLTRQKLWPREKCLSAAHSPRE